jgi:tetratricopeptide (TPR) repeat protein
VQLLLSDFLQSKGERDQALAACHQTLEASNDPRYQARALRRLGKLHEGHNPTRALWYYGQAMDKLASDAPERADVLIDRAWIYIIREEWELARADLESASGFVADAGAGPARRKNANVHDAFASFYRKQKDYDQAIRHAERALAIREEMNDQPRIAASHNNLGNLYAEMGQVTLALAHYDEALTLHRKLGNRESMGNALLNIGAALYDARRLPQAIEQYRASLEIFQHIGLQRKEVQAHYNLAEAWATLGQADQASLHWQAGYSYSQRAGLEDQVEWFEKLRDASPTLQSAVVGSSGAGTRAAAGPGPLAPHEQKALELAQRDGSVTPQTMMQQAYISKSTATRVLQGLVQRGLLAPVGQGRGTRYVLPESFTASSPR